MITRAMSWTIAVVAIVGACRARRGTGAVADAGAYGPEAGHGSADGGAADATTRSDAPLADAACDATSDAGTCCVRRRIYLDFDGVALVASASDDARTNHSVTVTSDVTVPAFLAQAADRDTVIANVVTQLAAQLARYDVVLARARPSDGDYVMIVFGGDSASIYGQAGLVAVGPLDCGDQNRNNVALVFDSSNVTLVANSAMYVLGLASGLSPTTLAGDCLSPTVSAATCTLSAAAPLGVPACPGAADPQDEPAGFASDLRCQ
jgi:hypothetical protein